ncbi:uncharacterized protein LOC102804827 [Saccoglossus kowalevskii]|uniref:Uncharacterized protein LOC102804827 n=1 Tax=Saccoglossus kowalevskii TaxID=10224 RepID=A0ABM0MKJ9_SACKO|nr:PREDICTED: uncharacterized protein LOC102804827 [Saccoglossus kowalevskii]
MTPSVTAFDARIHLSRGSVGYDTTGLIIRITCFKTIQFGERVLHIPILAILGSALCPVSAYKQMVDMLPAPSEAPLFLAPSSTGSLHPLTYQSFVRHPRSLLSSTGLDPNSYSGHSFRRGGASFAFQLGADPESIKAQGDWHSQAYLLYMESLFSRRLRTASCIRAAIKSGQVDLTL